METDIRHSEKIRQRIKYETCKPANLGDISATSEKLMPDPLQILQSSEAPTLSQLTEALIFWSQKELGQDVFIEEHKDFQNRSGTAFYDDQFYNERMGYFLDYFIFQKKLNFTGAGHPLSPLEAFLSSPYIEEAGLSNNTKTILYDLKKYTHSAFLVMKSAEKKLVVKDLFTKKKIEILGQGIHYFQQYSRPVIFQGFLFNFLECNHLSNGLVIHDFETNKYILKNIKKVCASDIDWLDELFLLGKQNLTYTRLRNITAKAAYQKS
ncbi:MAG: hypothetical protein R3B45_11585 [Bdellovibrionota bacterium]